MTPEVKVKTFNCVRCKDKGWFWIQSGQDDVDYEPCFDCQSELELGRAI
jgi:hypothetical protein